MSTNNYYIFCSSEIWLLPDGSLPRELPAEFSGSIIDTLDLTLAGEPSRAVLLSETVPRQQVVAASVSDAAGATSAGTAAAALAAGNWHRLRTLIASPDQTLAKHATPATRALGLLNWHNGHRFCGRCGAPHTAHDSEMALVCKACKSTVYPRLSPAIIVLVQKGQKILLARHRERNQDVYACIAGYVEHGETLEECVAREVFEETGLKVTNIRYAGSQSWPYPDQYMIAFYADWESGEIRVDPAEILEACWFDRDHLPNYPMPGTVAWRLINGVLHPLSKK